MFKRIAACAILALAVSSSVPLFAKPPADVGPVNVPVVDDANLVQIALLLDTSNSMDGLIAQAKTQLWRIVNETGRFRRDGRPVRVQVALYEYGNNNLSPGEGYIRMVLPLTDDLDKVSEKLFSLTTNGGDEYCGQVIQSAVFSLRWSNRPDAYKAIFVCGNEPFTQGSVDFRSSCAAAVSRGLVVNTIHCGASGEGVSGHWEDGAVLGHGRFMNINQDQRVCAIQAPQDAEITRLNGELNTTYVPYGERGREGYACQADQDKNAATPAAAAAGAPVLRAVTKSGSNYTNGGWDLVDALKEGRCKVEDVKKDELPEKLQAMSVDERKAFLSQQSQRRGDIQNQIRQLNDQREKFVAEEQKKQAAEKPAETTLDAAMIKAIQEQLKNKQFQEAGK